MNTTAPITIDYAKKFLEGRLLFIPKSLRDESEFPYQGIKKERKELIWLIWSVIASTHREHKRSKWSRVHHQRFIFCSSPNTSKSALMWLIENGFIEVPKGKNSYKVGCYPKKYLAKRKGAPVLVELENKRVIDGIIRKTDNDPACSYTRDCLDALQVNKASLESQLLQVIEDYEQVRKGKEKGEGERKRENKEESKVKNLYLFGLPLLALYHKRGRIIRGPKGNRLYSPITNLKKELRQCFNFGEEMVWYDMQCAQPNLLGFISKDEKLVDDCCTDRFYGQIMESLNVGRKKAKKRYCSYAYDIERPETPTAQMMREQYPKAAEYVSESKKGNYKKFSWQMQRMEADLFIDRIYLRLKDQQIPSLTIHDSIGCPQKHKQTVKETIEEELKKEGVEAKIREEE